MIYQVIRIAINRTLAWDFMLIWLGIESRLMCAIVPDASNSSTVLASVSPIHFCFPKTKSAIIHCHFTGDPLVFQGSVGEGKHSTML